MKEKDKWIKNLPSPGLEGVFGNRRPADLWVTKLEKET